MSEGKFFVHAFDLGYALGSLYIDDFSLMLRHVLLKLKALEGASRADLRSGLERHVRRARVSINNLLCSSFGTKARSYLEEVKLLLDDVKEKCTIVYSGGPDATAIAIAEQLASDVQAELGDVGARFATFMRILKGKQPRTSRNPAYPVTRDLGIAGQAVDQVSQAAVKWVAAWQCGSAGGSGIYPLAKIAEEFLHDIRERAIDLDGVGGALNLGLELAKIRWDFMCLRSPSHEQLKQLRDRSCGFLSGADRSTASLLFSWSETSSGTIVGRELNARLSELRYLYHLLRDEFVSKAGDGGAAGPPDDTWYPPPEILADFKRYDPPLSPAELEKEGFRDFVAVSEASRRAATVALNYLQAGANILLMGMRGTGKEILVRDLDRIARGVVAAGKTRLLSLNVRTLDDQLGIGALVGVAKRSATGVDEQPGLLGSASKIFQDTHKRPVVLIDELQNADSDVQETLLRILDPQNPEYTPKGSHEAKPVNATVICTTNEDLWKMRDEGRFRYDLLDRLEEIAVWIPPLWDRPGDVAGIYEKVYQDKFGVRPALSTAERQGLAHLVKVRWKGGRFIYHRVKTCHKTFSKENPPKLTDVFPELKEQTLSPAEKKVDLVAEVRKHLPEHKGKLSELAKLDIFHTDEEKERLARAGGDEAKQKIYDTVRKRLSRLRDENENKILHDQEWIG